MNIEEVYRKANQIDLKNNAFTVNEHLYHSGLMQTFEKALVKNKPLAFEILIALKVDSKSIERIVFSK
ncbi:hypothetical protein LX97_01170 [Nonlabens dokdonensis]|jgi:hypothetical protein|uniref:Uncharacterized protein n=2 Tax=Nonlabens dokdonensis TaxID=328515 RepID=L7WC78_NONDD|nr:hypothetical protein [Nonlabens dokdonensis]AGC76508.1 hypothetical protein DDD_1381 [Nonlabens dokdonensis DSW-6]PZX44161.1 hypothetical protein LX97_01170 [Nonlabens dokdonensis]